MKRNSKQGVLKESNVRPPTLAIRSQFSQEHNITDSRTLLLCKRPLLALPWNSESSLKSTFLFSCLSNLYESLTASLKQRMSLMSYGDETWTTKFLCLAMERCEGRENARKVCAV